MPLLNTAYSWFGLALICFFLLAGRWAYLKSVSMVQGAPRKKRKEPKRSWADVVLDVIRRKTYSGNEVTRELVKDAHKPTNGQHKKAS